MSPSEVRAARERSRDAMQASRELGFADVQIKLADLTLLLDLLDRAAEVVGPFSDGVTDYDGFKDHLLVARTTKIADFRAASELHKLLGGE